MSPASKIPVGILGATGTVGRRLVERLVDHPLFEIGSLAASGKSAGRAYGETAAAAGIEPPPSLGDRILVRADPDEVPEPVVFSALDAGVAVEVEPRFACAGRVVVSNARAFRGEPDVPLVVPEVNPDHLALIARQRRRRGWEGALVTNPNCSTIGLALALAPIHRVAGVERVVVATLQAASGAGYPGVASLDLIDNAIPAIPGEEDKIAREPLEILGELREDRVEPAEIAVSASTHRVPVLDGHLLAIHVGTHRRLDVEAARAAFAQFEGEPQRLRLPSAPRRPLAVVDDPQRPQPRRDRDRGAGMTVTVGGIRSCPVMGLAFRALCHNTIRGAAGGTLLIAELMHARGMLA